MNNFGKFPESNKNIIILKYPKKKILESNKSIIPQESSRK